MGIPGKLSTSECVGIQVMEVIVQFDLPDNHSSIPSFSVQNSTTKFRDWSCMLILELDLFFRLRRKNPQILHYLSEIFTIFGGLRLENNTGTLVVLKTDD